MVHRPARRPSGSPSAPTLEPLERRRLLSTTLPGGTGMTPEPVGNPTNGVEVDTSLPSVEVRFDDSRLYQTWDGAGASIDQWKFGGTYADPKFFNDLVGDVGVNIVRVPVWQGFENVNDNGDANATDLDAFDSAALDPTMRFLQQFEKRTDLKVLATVWTPPYWMKTNSAHNRGGTLRADMYEEFAEYLSAYVQVAQRDYGVDIDVLSLQNEPFFVEGYESAVYTPDQMVRLMKTVGERFERDGIETRLSAHEDLNYYDRFEWWADTLLADPEVADMDFVWGTHHVPQSTWDDVRGVVQSSGKPLWLTESGGAPDNTWRAALHLSDTIAGGMNRGDLSAFLDWQLDGNGNSSLYLYGNKGPRYYAMKHYAHWIRPGARRAGLTLGATDFDGNGTPDGLATGWYDPARDTQTLVLTNKGNTDAYFHVSGTDGALRGWGSTASDQFVSAEMIPDASGVSVRVPANGIVTLYNGEGDPVEWTPSNTHRGGWDYVLAPDATNNGFQRGVNHTALNGDYYGTTRVANAQNIQAKYLDGRNTLFFVAASPMSEVVRLENWLIDQGANPNDVDGEGITPTMVAASNPWVLYGYDQNLSVLKTQTLVDRGGSLAVKDFKGRTALHWAATTAQFDYGSTKAQDPRVVNYLLSAGADVNKVDRFGKTPADWAEEMGNTANLAAIDAWASDTVAPELLERTYDFERRLSVTIDFDEAMAGLTSGELAGALRLGLLGADGSVQSAAAFRTRTTTLAAGNTRLEVLPNPYTLADGYYRLDNLSPTLRDAAGNAFRGSLGSFSFLGGDANHDKRVDLSDFIIVRRNFGKRGVGFSGGDFDFDGVVGLNDFNVLRRQLGRTLGPAPEGFGESPLPGTPEAAAAYSAPGTPGASVAALSASPGVKSGRFAVSGGLSPFGGISILPDGSSTARDDTVLAELK